MSARKRVGAAATPSSAAVVVNRHRGEAKFGPYKLCLTMNALVEIEEGLGTKLSQLGEVLKEPSMKQIRLIIGALARGGGATMIVETELGPVSEPISDEEVGKQLMDIAQATVAIEQAFTNAGVFEAGGAVTPGKASRPAPSPPPGLSG